MKYVLLIMLTIGSLNIICQDNLNSNPLLFNYNGHTNSILKKENLEIDKNFIIGWQWGGHPRIAKNLYTNMIQSTYYSDNFLNYTDLDYFDPAPNNYKDERIYTVLGPDPWSRDMPSNLQAGIYIVNIKHGTESRTQKVMVEK